MSAGLTIRNGSVRVRIFASRTKLVGRDSVEPKLYTRWELRWTDHHGEKRRVKRSKLSEAKKEATRIAEDLARGHHHAELTLADLASFRAGIVNLYGTGKTLELATAEYAEAYKILVGRSCRSANESLPSLPDLAKFYIENRPTTLVTLTVADAVALCLQSKTQQGLSARWLGALKGQLHRFRDDHKNTLCQALTAADVRQWAYNLHLVGRDSVEPSKKLAGPRSRNNHLAAVKLLFQLAELRAHRERQNILDIPPVQVAESENALWTPDEFQQLLTAASDELLPCLVLGGFAKIRASEIRRMTWSQIKLSESRVLLRVGQTKTKRWRIVPLPAAAVAWLRYCQSTGPGERPIWPWGSTKFSRAMRAVATTCKLTWRDNALRNSAVTYDQICNPDVARVAREAGNSAAVLETEYFALHGITKDTAEAWFAIMPPKRNRVIVELEAKRA